MSKKNIIVASTNQNLYTTKRLLEEAVKLKCTASWVNPYQFSLPLKLKQREGLYLHRSTGTNYDDFDLLVSQFHELEGMRISNPLLPVKMFRNKDQQYLFFLKEKLPHIKSFIYRGHLNDNDQELLSHFHQNDQFIIKMIRGNQGIGVNYIESKKSLYSVLETFQAMKDQRFIIQPFIKHQREWRLLINRSEILACIEKQIGKDEFRGNAKRAKTKNLKKIPEGLRKLGLTAFVQSGLDYAGIDILEDSNGEYLLLEINPIAGFEQAEELSGVNIARELLALIHYNK